MGFRSVPKVGKAQAWIGLIALVLWLVSLSAHAQGSLPPFLVPPNRVCHALPLHGPNAHSGKLKDHQVPASTQGNGQAQVSEGETGGDSNGGADLIPGQPVLVPSPGEPERAGGLPGPRPPFLPGWPAGGTWPRPPPGC